MKSFEIVDSFGDSVQVEAELFLCNTYDFMGNKMPGLGIQLFDFDEDGYRGPYATLTLNFGEFLSVRDCAYIDTNNCSWARQLLEMGFCKDTGFTKEGGRCSYPLWMFDRDFLKAIDVNRLYGIYEKKFEEYMSKGPQAPLKDREMEVVSDVLDALGVTFEMDANSDGMTIWANDTVYYGGEIYRYLLAEVCEYEENGAVKGMTLDLCNDFYDLCEMNKVYPSDYNQPAKFGDMEYVITMSSGGGTVRDFMTLPSFQEAFEICEGYGWAFMDENEFEWELEIDEREVPLDRRLEEAKERSKQTLDGNGEKDEKELL